MADVTKKYKASPNSIKALKENQVLIHEREDFKEVSSKGGKNSVKKKKEFRHAKELLMDILSEDLTENEVIDILGHDIQNRNAYNVMLAKMHQVATKGNVKAFEALRDTVGDKPTEEVNLNANVITDNDRQLMQVLAENLGKMGINTQ